MLEGITSRLDPEPVKKEDSLQQIREIGDPTVIYTDGSATDGIRIGGAAIAVSEGDPETPHFTHFEQKKVHFSLVVMKRRWRQ